MASSDLCFKQIERLRAVAKEEEPAYAARSRLGRLVVTTARVIATRLSMPLPHVPQQITIPAGAPTELRSLADHTNRLLLGE